MTEAGKRLIAAAREARVKLRDPNKECVCTDHTHGGKIWKCGTEECKDHDRRTTL